jgi:hypothetical protein
MVLLRPWGRRSRNSSKLRVLAEEVQEWVRLRRVLEEHLFVLFIIFERGDSKS